METVYATIAALGILSFVLVVLAETCGDDSGTKLLLLRYAAFCGGLGYLSILGAAWWVTPSQMPMGTLFWFLLPVTLAITVYAARNGGSGTQISRP